MGADDLTPSEPPIAGNGGDRVFGNTAALVIGRLGVAAFGWAGSLIIVRTLSVDAFGRYTFIFGFLGVLSIVTDMGIGRVAIAGLSDPTRDRARVAGAYVVLRSALGVVGYVLAMLFVWLGGYSAEVVRATAIAGIVVLVATPANALEIGFQVRKKLHPVAIAGVVAQAAQFSITAAIAASGRGTLLLFTLPSIAYAVVELGYKLAVGRNLIPIKPCVDLRAWKDMLTEALPLAIGAALATLYYRIDMVMLSKMDTFANVGLYGVAYKFIDLAHYVPASLHRSVMVPLVDAWDDDRARFDRIVGHAYRLLFVTGALLVAELGVFGSDVAGLLYGRHYEAAGTAAGLVMGGEFFVFFTLLAWTALIAMGQTRVYAVAAGLGVVINVGLNLFLIPKWSYEGAAVATIVTNAAVAAVVWRSFVRAYGAVILGFRRSLLIVPAAAAAAAGGVLTRELVPWPVAAAATLVVFLGLVEVSGAAGDGGLRGLAGHA